MQARDVILVGAGHNGLVAATLLARAGLRVTVLEQKSTVGGAAKTEYPFKRHLISGSLPGPISWG